MKSYIGGDDEVPTVCDTGTEDYLDKACCFLEKNDDGQPGRRRTRLRFSATRSVTGEATTRGARPGMECVGFTSPIPFISGIVPEIPYSPFGSWVSTSMVAVTVSPGPISFAVSFSTAASIPAFGIDVHGSRPTL